MTYEVRPMHAHRFSESLPGLQRSPGANFLDKTSVYDICRSAKGEMKWEVSTTVPFAHSNSSARTRLTGNIEKSIYGRRKRPLAPQSLLSVDLVDTLPRRVV